MYYWKIPRKQEPGGLQSIRSHSVEHKHAFVYVCVKFDSPT